MPLTAYPTGIALGLPYVIEAADGTRAAFNNPLDPDHVGYLVGDDAVTGLEGGSIRESADTIPEHDGGVHGTFRSDRLAFTLKGILEVEDGPSLARQARLLHVTNALRADSRLLFTPSGIPLEVRFRAQQRTRITDRRPKTFLVAGVSEEPVILAVAASSVTIDPAAQAAIAGGLASPMTSPLTSGQGVLGQASAVNRGSADAWPILTVEGPATNPSIRNATTGEELNLIYTLGAGETLVIDTNPRRRTVRLGGTANRYGAIDFPRSAWPRLLPGTNDLRLSFAAYSAGAKLTASWRDAWG